MATEGPLELWLAAAGADPAGTGVFVDFDGTLSPIVDDPAAARPIAGTAALLAELADRLGLVAVVSGRPVAFLAEHLAGAGRTRLHGLYGLERAGPDGVEVEPAARRWRPVVAAAAAAAGPELPPGAAVEPKGLTVTIHYRAVPDRAGQVHEVATRLAVAHGLVAHRGKMSVELRPPLEVDKATVLSRLSAPLANVAYAGDDLGDLPAFAVLGRLREQGRTTLTIAAGGAEAPPEVLAAADVVVAGPEELVGLLRRLLSRWR